MQPITIARNDYRANPKQSNQATPRWVAEFIGSLFPDARRVLDPCAGEGALLAPFQQRGAETISYEISQGRDFLTCSERLEVDLVVCNPPWSGTGGKLVTEVWLDKTLEVVGHRTPIVLFAGMGFRLNQRVKSTRWRRLRDTVTISSIISLPLDVFEGVEFHAEVLIFNAEGLRLRPHYWLPDPLPVRMAALGRRTSGRKRISSAENGKRAQSDEARAKMRLAWERRRERTRESTQVSEAD